jgi:hypothetical protein
MNDGSQSTVTTGLIMAVESLHCATTNMTCLVFKAGEIQLALAQIHPLLPQHHVEDTPS